MKFIALLYAALVLVLSVLPCCALESVFEQRIQDQYKVEKSHHKQADDCFGHCAPFYTCGTCPGFVLTTSVAYPLAVLSIEPKNEHIIYLEITLQKLPASIWQPPKIG